MMLPLAFEEKMKKLLKDEYDSYLRCFEEPRLYGLRVNTMKISVADFQQICPFEITPIPWIENGFYYDGNKDSPAKHPYYSAGLYYLQEPSAMTPASRLPIVPGDKVLDICAAPGGKSTELGARLNMQGVLAANDISNSRAKGLLKNIEVFGIGNVLVLSEEPGKLKGYFNEYFDKILIDAPCSGEGMFRKDKKMIRAWEEHGPEFFAKIQKDILEKAVGMLKPGGMVLYSTCTFDPAENEQNIEYILNRHPDLHLKEMESYEGFAAGYPEVIADRSIPIERTIRIWPHRMKGEGHYLALLGKDGVLAAEPGKGKREKRRLKLPEELVLFLTNVRWNIDIQRIQIHGERVYYMPADIPDMSGVRFLRSGLMLGELKKNRFEPSQALAMCLRMKEYQHCINWPVTDERVIRYLKGETITVSDNSDPAMKGWRLICVDGYPLGWGKIAGGMLKNKYLPGWRW